MQEVVIISTNVLPISQMTATLMTIVMTQKAFMSAAVLMALDLR